MLKKFVPLNVEVAPFLTPCEITTFTNPVYENIPNSKNSVQCSNKTPAKPCFIENVSVPKSIKSFTTEETILKLFEIPLKVRNQETKLKIMQRTPKTLNKNSIVREKYLKTKAATMESIHNARELSSNGSSLIKVDSPMFSNKKIRPRQESLETFYVASRKLLDLNAPKSGIFVNESSRPADSNLPFETYDPRKLQDKLNSEHMKKYILFSDNNQLYFPWQQGQDKLVELAFRQDCNNFKSAVFEIPNDLHKTFRAEVVFSNSSVSPYQGINKPQRPTEIACLYAAYIESFCKNPDYWTANTLDSLLRSGCALCEKSKTTQYENPSANFLVFPEITEKGATVEIRLHLKGILTEEPNILKALTLFFNQFNAAVLYSQNLYLLIWKRYGNSFYAFDPNGRNVHCKRDFESGKASLIAIQTVEHIVHLILDYSDVSNKSVFELYEIELKDFEKQSNLIKLEKVKHAKKKFAVVNQFYSIIPAVTGLPVIPKANNDSMMISYLALVYSQIDASLNWTVQLVDDFIRFGKKYSTDFMYVNQLRTLNITDLPEVLLFGNYRALIEKRKFTRAGHIVECLSYRDSQLTQDICNHFSEYDAALLQVDSTTLGLWKEQNVFYVFDSFKRGPAGQATVRPKTGVGCLQIHLNISSLCRIVFMNSIAIKTEGNFFLHGIRIKAIGTFNINHALEKDTEFRTLRIKYPLDCTKILEIRQGCIEKALESNVLNCTITQCLSKLSVSPCGRTCSERDFLVQQKKKAHLSKLTQSHSIQSISEEYRIPEFDSVDVIYTFVVEFICNLFPTIQNRNQTKSEHCIEASKILLQSDRRHLEDLELCLKHGKDYNNICAALQTNPPTFRDLTLEDERAVETNFISLPDGSWAIFGITDIETASESFKGILATIAAAALSSKFNISTWTCDTIEYVLETSVILEKRFWSYSHTLDLIFRNRIPKIQLGSTTHYLKVLTCDAVIADLLKDTLNRALLEVNRLLIICKGHACLILKRYNIIYMFMGYPCNVVGFRSNSASPMCLLKSVDTNTLLQRIESACGRYVKYVMVKLDVIDVTYSKSDRFKQRTESQDQLQFDREFKEKQREKKHYKEKMKFIQHEIRNESKRVMQFLNEKKHSRSKTDRSLTVSTPPQSSYSESDDENDVEEEDVFETSIELKHKPGKSFDYPEIDEFLETTTTITPTFGYQLTDVDCMFKIQGSTSLEERLKTSLDTIRACFFTSTIALIYAILRPLNQWDSQRIDKVIHVGKNITKGTKNLTTSSERIIKNIDVDEFNFDVKVQTFEPIGSSGSDIEYIINKVTMTHHYFLIHIANGTFGVYHDKYFHLFDPYPSMELAPDQVDVTDEEELKCPELIQKQPERNTASWVLFGDLYTMFNYLQRRATNSDWKMEFKLYIITILSYKTAPKPIQLHNQVIDAFDSSKQTLKSVNLCTNPEDIKWLEIYPSLVIWSRLNRLNAIQRLRGSALTKDNEFDIEIPDKLYSLWGSIHPLSTVFGKSRGKQHLAINVVACCMANVYKVDKWNRQILDYIVINGNQYYNHSVNSITRRDYEISLENLNTVIEMGHFYFEIHLESVNYGCLYAKDEMNLAAALTHFFTNFDYGIVQCMQRAVAIGKIGSGFFMFECQSHGLPLFQTEQGAAYVLRVSQLQILLYCIVMTMNVPYYNAKFTILKVEMISKKINELEE